LDFTQGSSSQKLPKKAFSLREKMEKSVAKEKRRKGSQVFIVGFVVNFIITIFNPWI
jgi:hypothetical protein